MSKDLEKIEESLQTFLATKAEKVRSLQSTMCLNAIDIGKELHEVREICEEKGFGKWADWVREECNLKKTQTYNYITFFERWSAESKGVRNRLAQMGIMKGVAIAMLPGNIDVAEFLDSKVDEEKVVEDLSSRELQKLVKYFQDHPDAVLEELPKILTEDTLSALSSANVRITPEYKALEKIVEKYAHDRGDMEAQIIYLKSESAKKQKELDILSAGVNDPDAVQEEVEKLRAANDDLQNQLEDINSKKRKALLDVRERLFRSMEAAKVQVIAGVEQAKKSVQRVTEANDLGKETIEKLFAISEEMIVACQELSNAVKDLR